MNINKRFLLIASIIILVANFKSIGQLQFEPIIMGQFGYENNIFKAPNVLLDNLGDPIPESELIKSDMFLDYGYNLGFRYKAKRHNFYIDQGFWGRNFFNYQSLNQYSFNLNLKYKYKISKHFETGIKYDISKNNKIGTSALGDELQQKFSYLKNNIELFLDYEIAKYTDLELAINYYNKYYDKDPAVIPLDANNFGSDLKFTQDLNSGNFKSTVFLKINYAIRKYSDLIALDSSGNLNTGNPLRDWRYFGVDFEYKISQIGKFSFAPYYWYDNRNDQFEDYYSYNSNELGLKIYYKGDKLNFKLAPSYSVTKYEIKKAPDPNGIDPLLVYKYFDLDLQMNYLLYKGINLSLDFNTSNRYTNTLNESYKTRRGYNSFEIMVGFSFNPYQLYVDRKKDEDERK
ncbi:MAG: hypothetical protein A2W99_10245 [Bacteroidetes bacterium GWF2_33_16]|nr:MAG: hypothetical protein A2X00_05495 [Bacteroidetes bacterium GWE2_32_14]OFY03928.1 MAG: hypothetical protein A2W99_10245 [Bacteroidetes bacterium GWF2_33_16]